MVDRKKEIEEIEERSIHLRVDRFFTGLTYIQVAAAGREKVRLRKRSDEAETGKREVARERTL